MQLILILKRIRDSDLPGVHTSFSVSRIPPLDEGGRTLVAPYLPSAYEMRGDQPISAMHGELDEKNAGIGFSSNDVRHFETVVHKRQHVSSMLFKSDVPIAMDHMYLQVAYEKFSYEHVRGTIFENTLDIQLTSRT